MDEITLIESGISFSFQDDKYHLKLHYECTSNIISFISFNNDAFVKYININNYVLFHS